MRLGGEILTCTPLDMTENNANQWTAMSVSGSVQIRNDSLTNIRSIEIHADTWEYGFTLWLDGVQFDPPLRCASDVNGDGCVDDADLLRVLFAFGSTGSNLPEDLNRDGVVDDADLLEVLFNFGGG